MWPSHIKCRRSYWIQQLTINNRTNQIWIVLWSLEFRCHRIHQKWKIIEFFFPCHKKDSTFQHKVCLQPNIDTISTNIQIHTRIWKTIFKKSEKKKKTTPSVVCLFFAVDARLGFWLSIWIVTHWLMNAVERFYMHTRSNDETRTISSFTFFFLFVISLPFTSEYTLYYIATNYLSKLFQY